MTTNEEQLYQEHILAHYEDPYHRGRCSRCTHVHADSNPLCGDKIRIELHVDDHGQMREIFFDGEGCCISQAAASMLVERFDGKSIDEVKQFSAQDMLAMFGVRLTPNRQKCALLSWKVLQAAIYSPVEAAERIAQCERMESQPSDADELHQLSAPGDGPADGNRPQPASAAAVFSRTASRNEEQG